MKKWLKRFEELKEFIDEHKKLPSNENKKAKILSTWLFVQNIFYEQKIFNEEQNKLFKIFLENNFNLFKFI